jgi:recombination protein RecA
MSLEQECRDPAGFPASKAGRDATNPPEPALAGREIRGGGTDANKVDKEQQMSKQQQQDPMAMRNQTLSSTLEALEKRWGKGAVMRLGEGQKADVEVVPSGSLSLDRAMGIGGYPRGRVVEIYGHESSGKTTLALHAIAEVQRRNGIAAFIDAEHALDVTYARKLGVDVDALLVAQPDHGEQALEIAETLLRSGAVELVVVDSVAALVPQAEIDGDMGDLLVGLQARLMSQAMRKITAVTARSQAIMLFINQTRQKIGVTFGNGETTTGGNALKFYASIRLDIRRIGAVKKGEDVVGNRTKIKVIKNKLAPPFKSIEVDIMYGRGVCQAGELLERAEESGLLTKSGSWYSLGDQRLGQGFEAVREQLVADRKLYERLAALVVQSAAPASAK